MAFHQLEDEQEIEAADPSFEDAASIVSSGSRPATPGPAQRFPSRCRPVAVESEFANVAELQKYNIVYAKCFTFKLLRNDFGLKITVIHYHNYTVVPSSLAAQAANVIDLSYVRKF